MRKEKKMILRKDSGRFVRAVLAINVGAAIIAPVLSQGSGPGENCHEVLNFYNSRLVVYYVCEGPLS